MVCRCTSIRGWWAFRPGEDITGKDGSTACRGLSLNCKERVPQSGDLVTVKAAQGGVTVLGMGELSLAGRRRRRGLGGCHDLREGAAARRPCLEGFQEVSLSKRSSGGSGGGHRSAPVLQPRPGRPRPRRQLLSDLKAEATPGQRAAFRVAQCSERQS